MDVAAGRPYERFMGQDAWNPQQYERFRSERAAPFYDLFRLVEREPGMRVVDLGCGTGEWTHHAHVELGATSTVGIDTSSAMLAKAAPRVMPGLTFEQKDIRAWAKDAGSAGARYDLVFSNAALHWLRSHEELFESITRTLAPRGQLAVQVPANFDHPTHVVANEVAHDPEFAAKLEGTHDRTEILSPEAYATLFHRLGFATQHVRLQVYPHVLDSREGAIEWVKGSLLTAFEKRLSPGDFARFLTVYRERLFAIVPDEHPFFFPFKRVLMWGRLP
jgi:trans-aconitate 2-methyltransferase